MGQNQWKRAPRKIPFLTTTSPQGMRWGSKETGKPNQTVAITMPKVEGRILKTAFLSHWFNTQNQAV